MSPKPPPPIEALLQTVNAVVLGKTQAVQECVACLLAGGHLLIEDVPGVGKTTLARTLAQAMGLIFTRVQFTSDLMPSDLIGISVFNKLQDRFVFHRGPLFTQVLLADEINRSSPRTQSALLEAMEERQVSTEGQTRTLPSPFFVIATQNPSEQLGTHPLPESQLDRFLLRISLGYPDRTAERQLLQTPKAKPSVTTEEAIEPVWTPDDLRTLQHRVTQVHVSEPLLDYLQDVLQATRDGSQFVQGLSPRAGMGWLRAAQAMALIAGRDHVSPDDLQNLWPKVARHRLQPTGSNTAPGADPWAQVLARVPLR